MKKFVIYYILSIAGFIGIMLSVFVLDNLFLDVISWFIMIISYILYKKEINKMDNK